MTTPAVQQTPSVRYPAGEITPHGWWHMVNDTRPWMWLDSFDGSVRLDMLGPLAPPFHDPMLPEAVAVKGLKGLIAPWQHIDQKGATEDGITQVDALLDPIEAEMVVECIARDQKHLRRVHRDLIGSIDAIRRSKVSWFTHELGLWWAPIRWYKGAPPDGMANQQKRRQQVTLRLRADRGCWQSFPDIAQFGFTYDSMVENFAINYGGDQDLGPNWPQHYDGAGGGYFSTTDGSFGLTEARWFEFGHTERSVVNGPYKDFDTDTDNQVVEIELGVMPDLIFLGGAYNDIWGRMGRNPDGSWDGNGIRARVGRQGTIFGFVEIARFNDFVPTVMWWRPLLIPPLYGEKFSLVCGVAGDPRTYQIRRNGLTILTHKEIGEASNLGVDFRGIGFGALAGEGIITQSSPAWVRGVSAGDNATISQSGFLERTNIGDQPMYDDYVLFGPGIFRIYDGPGSADYVEFGPILANQIVYMRTDPRSKATLVKDLTVAPSTPQEQNIFQEAIDGFLSFAFANNVPPLLGAVTNIFGNTPPQGNLYKFLKGRFSDRAAIPPKSPGNPAKKYHVKVEIVDGTAESKILASGTPLRRYPL